MRWLYLQLGRLPGAHFKTALSHEPTDLADRDPKPRLVNANLKSMHLCTRVSWINTWLAVRVHSAYIYIYIPMQIEQQKTNKKLSGS